MKRTDVPLLCLLAITFTSSGATAAAQADGKAVFLEKCQTCHTVRSEGITAAGPQQATINWTRQCPDCTADLSGVGERRKPDWLKAYLRNDKKGPNGLKHEEVPLVLKGEYYIVKGGLPPAISGAETDAVIAWLITVKAVPPDATPPPPPRPASAWPPKAKAAPMPKEEAARLLLSAKNVAVVGQTGKLMMDRLMWNPDGARAKRNVEEVIADWGRYKIVSDREDADLVIVVTEFQKNVLVIGVGKLVCEMTVFPGGQQTGEPRSVWSDDASEGLHQPSRKVAEKFRDFVKALGPR